MRSSNARRRALSRLAIIIMMALVVVFLVSVAPVSGASKKVVCKDKCYKKERVTDKEDVIVKTCVRTCLLRGQYKWKITTKKYDIGHYEQWCDDMTYCPNSGCMKVGEYNKLEDRPGYWKKLTETIIEYKWLPKNAPSPCSA